MSEELVFLGNPTKYPVELRKIAADTWQKTGNLAESARQAGVPYETVKEWSKSEWWREYQDDLKSQSRAVLKSKLSKLSEKALTEVEDRLQNGDMVFDQKTGELVRKPINAEVANRILQDSLSKTLEVEKLQSQEKSRESEEKMADRLVKLAREFARFADAKTLEGKFHAVHEEREAGLQEGTELGSPTP